MLDAILQDIRYAIRGLRSSPGFAAVAILSLALGIGANTAIFSLINSLFLKPLPVSHPEQLLQVTMGKNGYFSNPIWEQIRDRQDVFSRIFAYGMIGERLNLAAGGEAHYAHGNVASSQFFDTLGLHAIIGRTFTMVDDRRGCPGTAVLSYDFWLRQYEGRADAVGKTVLLDHHPFEILGIIGPGFSGVDAGSEMDLYIPVCAERIIRGETSEPGPLRVVGRPKPGISPIQVEARLKTLAPQIFEATIEPNWNPQEQENYRKGTFDIQLATTGLSFIREEYRQALLVLMAIVGLVLLIACANVANLLLARNAARQREIAIRIALGSGRGRLIRQLTTESLLLSLAGAALGILFSQWGTRLLVGFLSYAGTKIFLDLSIDSHVLAFTGSVAILTGVLFGTAPAWRGTRVNPQLAMKANGRGAVDGSFGLGKAIVVLQLALSLALVVGAGLMLTTFFQLETLDPGFQRTDVILVGVDLSNGHYPPRRNGAIFQEIREHLRALPSIRSASSSDATPIDNTLSAFFLQVEGYNAKSEEDTGVYFNEVSDRYFETLGTDVITGRDFNKHDTPESPKVAIVNQSLAAKFFPGRNPVGAQCRRGRGDGKLGDLVEIIGMVKDAKYTSLRERVQPTLYFAASQDPNQWQSTTFEVRVAGGSPTAVIPVVKSLIAEVNRDISLDFKPLALQVDESISRERLLATLSGFFGGLALLLAMMGLYGVMSYNVTRRRNEIGIRMALGAEPKRVLRMVMQEVALLIGIGLAIGLGLTLSTTRLLASLLFGLTPRDPLTLSLAVVILAGVACLAGYLQARRASRLEPLTALREE